MSQNNYDHYDLGLLSGLSLEQWRSVIAEKESEFDRRLSRCAANVFRCNIKLIFLAGPSCSGKTVTSKKFCHILKEQGVSASCVSLDDFFFGRDKLPILPDGSVDFESPATLDMDCFSSTMNDFIKGKVTKIPVFDFKTGMRSADFTVIEPSAHSVLIIEGLHALNPLIWESFDSDCETTVSVCPQNSYAENGEVIFTPFDIRFMRRLVRDNLFRSSSAENTLGMWPGVRFGEEKYIFSHIGNAETVFNTSLPYDLFALKNRSVALLTEVSQKHPQFGFADSLRQKLESVHDSFSDSLIPNGSLLREFIGGSPYFNKSAGKV